MALSLVNDEHGDPLPWVGEGVVVSHAQGTMYGKPVPVLSIREDRSEIWHRVGLFQLWLEGLQTLAIVVQPIGRTSIFVQIAEEKILVCFDLHTMKCVKAAQGVPVSTFLRDMGNGWYLCAIGFTPEWPVMDVRVGICDPGTSSYKPFQGRPAMGFDMAEAISAPGLGLAHPEYAFDFPEVDEDGQRLQAVNRRTERILSAWRGLIVERKIKIAQAKASPKVIVVGASNVLYGVHASVLEEELRMPAANLGLAAGLGLARILEAAKDILKRGDIAVLAIELFFFSKDWLVPDFAGINASPDFNDNGDYLDNLASGVTESMRRDVENLPAIAPGREYHQFDPSGDAEAAVREFVAWARENGVRVICSWPVMYAPTIEPARALFTEIDEFYRSLEMTILGEPIDTTYPLTWFYDTNNHLHADAAVEHSRRLAAMLRSVGVGQTTTGAD